MLYASVEGIKRLADPGLKGQCLLCEQEAIPKCGDFRSWHWAHKRARNCDSWYQPETEWHRSWKKVFGTSQSEIILIKEGQKHIADIKTYAGKIIELQNSPIDYETLVIRERFYRDDLNWIVHGTVFMNHFVTTSLSGMEYDTYSPEFEYFSKIHGFSTNYMPDAEVIQERFYWKYSREVWRHAVAPVYLDFGDEFLFLITKWHDTSRGIVQRIRKQKFLLENGGDESLLYSIIVL